MDRRNAVRMSLGVALLGSLAACGRGEHKDLDATPDDGSSESLATVMAFMDAMGKGDMDAMSALMADDMVWHNEGDTSLPWIGVWEGKQAIFEFLPVFSSNLETTLWENGASFASGDTVAVFGKMAGIATKTGQETGEFSFALQAKVADGKLTLWHWYEDSFAISQAYHGKA